MASGLLHNLGFWAVIALAMGAFALWSVLSERRRKPLRHAAWKELCLRLELVAEPGDGQVASGRHQGVDFRLRDTGSSLLLELPLPQPLLPPGLVLLSARSRELRPPGSPRRLRLRAPSRWEPREWYMDPEAPPAEVEAPTEFLAEAQRALQVHAPLRVESRQLVQVYSGYPLPSVSAVHNAVRALHATARQWSEAAGRCGLPIVHPLPVLPSPRSLLRGVLGERGVLPWLLVMNAALPFTVAALHFESTAAVVVLLTVSLLGAFVWGQRRHGAFQGIALCLMTGLASVAAPMVWHEGTGLETSPSIIWVREAGQPEHRKASYFRFQDAVVRSEFTAPGVTPVMVPVVPKDWRRGELITVWATRAPPASRANAALKGGRVVKPTREIREATIEAARFLGFPIHAHAIWLDMSVDPDAEVANRNVRPFLLWASPNGLWLGWVLVAWARAVHKSRRLRQD
jgi:hypothetical protein